MNTPAYDLICIGTALVDSLIRGFDPNPISAAGYRATSGTLSVGGEAVNESMAAAKLGLKTAILCSLGQDDAGDMVAGTLARSGADTSLIIRSAENATPVTTMFVNDDGTRKSITNARAVILGSLFRAPFDDPAIIHAVLAAAKESGEFVFADTKLPNFRFLTLADIRESLPLIDYITPNEDEARYYTGKKDPEEMADVFLGLGVKSVIIKLGGKGCYFKNETISLHLPPCNITAVDATGAGDNFVAGFASEILRGADPVTALHFANACGAICTTAVGAGTALKSREQVLVLLGKR